MKTRSVFHIIIVLFLLINTISAEIDWRKYGWQIYDNAGEGRSLAMGNAGVAFSNPVAIIWNPGAVLYSNKNYISYGHQSRFAGIVQSDYLSIPLNTKNKFFNLIVLHESVGKIPKTTDLLLDWGLDGVPNTGDQGENNGVLDEGERLDSDNVSYFNQHQLGIHLSTKIQVFDFEIGVGVRSLIHKLGKNWGSGIGLDIGFVKSYWKSGYIGASFRNVIPAMMIWDSGFVELEKPQLLTGLSQTFSINSIGLAINLNGDLIMNIANQSLNDDFSIGNSGSNYRIGLELAYKEKLSIRFGRNQYGYLTTGVGLNWNYMNFNYAYQLNSTSADLGSTHVLSFDIDTRWIKSFLDKK